MKTLRVLSVLLLPLWVNISCQKKYVPPGGISTYLTGQWLLTKTVTPTDTTFAAAVGGQVLEVGNDTRRNFLSITQNGNETLRVFENHQVTNENAYTVDIYYSNEDMIRFFLKQKFENGSPQGVYEIQTTQFMRAYSGSADTVRYYYERIR